MALKFRSVLRDFLVITLASAVYAVAFNWFFLPNGLTMGGFTGASQVLNRVIPALPIGAVTILMNVPLFILGVRRLGLQLLFRMRKNGSRLTAEGRTMLGAYEEAEQAAWEAADAVMEKYFGGGADGKDPGNTAPA